MKGWFVPKKKPTDSDDIRGLSVYVSVGKWAGIGGGVDGGMLRICLGWVGVGIAAFDLERFLGMLASKLEADGLIRESGRLEGARHE